MQEKISKSKLEKFVKDSQEKVKECEEAGRHKKVKWYSYLVDDKSHPTDKVIGVCAHCGMPVSRSLNKKEYSFITSFYKKIKKYFII